MEKYKITYKGTSKVSDVHHIGMECNGFYYSVIFGRYVNGGFCSIPNWEVGCELADFSDVLYNSQSIGKVLEDYTSGRAIAEMIASVT